MKLFFLIFKISCVSLSFCQISAVCQSGRKVMIDWWFPHFLLEHYIDLQLKLKILQYKGHLQPDINSGCMFGLMCPISTYFVCLLYDTVSQQIVKYWWHLIYNFHVHGGMEGNEKNKKTDGSCPFKQMLEITGCNIALLNFVYKKSNSQFRRLNFFKINRVTCYLHTRLRFKDSVFNSVL